jgi:hypothetical protein
LIQERRSERRDLLAPVDYSDLEQQSEPISTRIRSNQKRSDVIGAGRGREIRKERARPLNPAFYLAARFRFEQSAPVNGATSRQRIKTRGKLYF